MTQKQVVNNLHVGTTQGCLSTDVFMCACSSCEHQFIFRHDPNDHSDVDMMYLSVHLQHTDPWWKRIVVAVKHIFGHNSKFGDWDDVMLDRSQVQALHDLTGKVLQRPSVDIT